MISSRRIALRAMHLQQVIKYTLFSLTSSSQEVWTQFYFKLYRRLLRLLRPILPERLVQELTKSGIASIEDLNSTMICENEIPYDLTAIGGLRANELDFMRKNNIKEDARGKDSIRNIRVWWLKNINLHSSNGVVIVGRNRIFSESIQKYWEMERAAFYRYYIPHNITYRYGLYTTISATYGSNYSHWYTESLSRLYIFSKLKYEEPVMLLMSDELTEFQRVTTQFCLPDGVQIEFVPHYSWINVENLIFPEFTRNCASYFLPIEVIDFLRTRIFDGIGLRERPKFRRLYISRADIQRKPGRRVLNEEDVFACLAKYGFELCLPQAMKFEEQVRLFSEAEVVIGPAGSALSNILFSNQAKVLEFQIDPPHELYYWRFSQLLGHEHHFFPVRQNSVEDDMQIDIKLLERKLEELL